MTARGTYWCGIAACWEKYVSGYKLLSYIEHYKNLFIIKGIARIHLRPIVGGVHKSSNTCPFCSSTETIDHLLLHYIWFSLPGWWFLRFTIMLLLVLDFVTFGMAHLIAKFNILLSSAPFRTIGSGTMLWCSEMWSSQLNSFSKVRARPASLEIYVP
jgi:hypothetical protein